MIRCQKQHAFWGQLGIGRQMLKVNKWSLLSIPWFWYWVALLGSDLNCFSYSCFLVCQTDSGNGWKWVDDSDIDQTLFPQSYRWPHNSWWSRTTFFGEGPHCLVIQPWVKSAKNQWDPTRCAYGNYFMCKLPKSAVVPTYTGPEGGCWQKIAVQCCAV